MKRALLLGLLLLSAIAHSQVVPSISSIPQTFLNKNSSDLTNVFPLTLPAYASGLTATQVCDSSHDTTAAFTAAATALTTGGTVSVPIGTCPVSSLTFTGPSFKISGTGQNSTVLQPTTTTGNFLSFGDGVSGLTQPSLLNLTITPLSTMTTGALVVLQDAHSGTVEKVNFSGNGYIGLDLEGGASQFTYQLHQLAFGAFSNACVASGLNASLSRPQDIYFTDSVVGNGCAIGEYIAQASGFYQDNIDILSATDTGFKTFPATGKVVKYLRSNNLLLDTSANAGANIADNGGIIDNSQFFDLWASNTSAGPGFEVTSANASQLSIMGGDAITNSQDGVFLNGGDSLSLIGFTTAYNNISNSTYGGVRVTAGSGVQLIGNKSGSMGSHTGSNLQTYGYQFDSTAGTHIAIGNYSTGNNVGLSDCSTAARVIMGNYTPDGMAGCAWGTSGLAFATPAVTLNDNTGTTVTTQAAYAFGAPTFTATNAEAITNLVTLYLAAPVASTNVTATNLYSLVAAGGISTSGNNFIVTAGGSMTAVNATIANTGQFAFGSRAFITAANSNVIQLGPVASATPSGQTLQAQGSRGGTDTNVAGGSLTFLAGAGTGNATGAPIALKTPHATTTGTTQQTYNTQISLGDNIVNMPNLTTGTNADFLCLQSGGNLLIQASACTISSLRFKYNVDMFGGSALNQVNKMDVDTFNLKPNGEPNADPNFNSNQIGLIAENIAKVAPKCAIYENDMKTPKSYRQECVIALLVKGEQELLKRIHTLERRH